MILVCYGGGAAWSLFSHARADIAGKVIPLQTGNPPTTNHAGYFKTLSRFFPAFSTTSGVIAVRRALWVLISNNRKIMDNPEIQRATVQWKDDITSPKVLWTDDFSNTVKLIRY